MAGPTPHDNVEVNCFLCGKMLSDDDDIFFTFSPYGFDFDVICAECHASRQQSRADGPPDGALALDEGTGQVGK